MSAIVCRWGARLPFRIVGVIAVLAATTVASPALARDMKGKAALIVRDAVTGKPLPGASVQFTAVVVKRKTPSSDPVEERKPVSENTATTDDGGFAMASVHVGASSGDIKRIETYQVAVQATRPGYKPLDAVGSVYYATITPPRVVVDDVLLAPADSDKESGFKPQLLSPEARVDPSVGEDTQEFTLRVRLRIPESLSRMMQQAAKDDRREEGQILHVFLHETDGTTGAETHKDKGYRKDLVELKRESSEATGEQEYAGRIRHPIQDPTATIDHLHLVIRAAEPGDTLFTQEGNHVVFTESKTRGVPLLGQEYRFNTVLLTVMSVPVRWAVGKTLEQARSAYEAKWGSTPAAGAR